MTRFAVLDPGGMGGFRMTRQHGNETKTVEAPDEVQAAAQATGFIGQFISTPWGAAEGCWVVNGEAGPDELFGRDGNRVLSHPGRIGVIVVRCG